MFKKLSSPRHKASIKSKNGNELFKLRIVNCRSQIVPILQKYLNMRGENFKATHHNSGLKNFTIEPVAKFLFASMSAEKLTLIEMTGCSILERLLLW